MLKNQQVMIFVHLYNDYSGSPCVLRDAIASLDKFEGQKWLLTSQHVGVLTGLPVKYIPVPYVYFHNKYAKLVSFILSQCLCFLLLSGLILSLRLSGHKVRVVTNTILPFAANLAAWMFAHRLIAYIHEVSIQPPQLFQLLKAMCLKLAHKRIYVSDYVKECFSDTDGVVVLNGLRGDFTSHHGFDLLSSSKFKHKKLLFVGTLRSYKGFSVFIDLAYQRPELNFCAVINATQKEFEAYIRERRAPLPTNLEIALRPKDLIPFYQSASLLLNLSDRRVFKETFGMTILEGFALGCPALVPSEGGHLSFCNEGNSIVVNTSSVESVLTEIDDLLDDYDRWYRLSECAFATSKSLSYSVFKQNIACQLVG